MGNYIVLGSWLRLILQAEQELQQIALWFAGSQPQDVQLPSYRLVVSIE
jgi:hypothetical protein